jgi:hypothetical protein
LAGTNGVQGDRAASTRQWQTGRVSYLAYAREDVTMMRTLGVDPEEGTNDDDRSLA